MSFKALQYKLATETLCKTPSSR